ncbi:MAG: ArsA family ATPase [Candidatus Geothermarchaeales archaeon]
MASKPHLRYIFTGGKGGVGKSTSAAAIAQHFSSQGEETLLVSLDPVHSISSLLGQDVKGGVIKKVDGADKLYAIEVETRDTVERYKVNIGRRIRDFLKWADIPLDPKPFIEIAATNPAFEESATFDKMIDIMLDQGEKYDRIVFDTAAVANAIRLIGLSKIYGLWLDRMIRSRQEALSLRVKLSFRKDKVLEEIKKDPLMADLMSMNERFLKAKELMMDEDKTIFFFVTIPLALPIAVVKRFIGMVQKFDIPIGGVIVNQVIPPEAVRAEKATEYIKNKFEEQKRYLEVIERDLGELVRSHIPLYPLELVGLEAIKRVSQDLFK